MRNEEAGEPPALAALRTRLADGLARSGLDKTQLAARARLGRTTVHNALQFGGPTPTAKTVAALARALSLPAEELLALHRSATGLAAGADAGPGMPIGSWDPYALEVHPAGSARTLAETPLPLSRYVHRRHDQVLARVAQESAAGAGRLAVLVGESSTGKTRACWEAIQPLADQGWKLWHPFDPNRAEAALKDLHRVQPRTVVWLNETQHYLDAPGGVGEQIAATIHSFLLEHERSPVLILGTIWPEYAHRYLDVPTPGAPDPHSRARELLIGRTITVPPVFDPEALTTAAVFAEDGDQLLADALTRTAETGRVAQDLAGAPELLRRYETGTPAARAVLEAAMDARRLGVGLHLPLGFLIDAATDYLADADYEQLDTDWTETALAEVARPVHGKQAPLRRVTMRPVRRPPGKPPATASPLASAGPMFRLADYLEQQGRLTRRPLCPPASFWYAAHAHLTHPDDLTSLGQAAHARHRLEWAHHLYQRAGARVQQAHLLTEIATLREQAGDQQGAEALARRAAEAGVTHALTWLARRRESAGDLPTAEVLARQALNSGDVVALERLAGLRERAGDQAGATDFACRAVDAGLFTAVTWLAATRLQAGDVEGAEILLSRATESGDVFALLELAQLRERTGNRDGAESLARQAAAVGDVSVLVRLAEMREQAGSPDQAEVLLRQAAGDSATVGAVRLAGVRQRAGDLDGAETLLRHAADAGDTSALPPLVLLLEECGRHRAAEDFALHGASVGDPEAAVRLTHHRERAGDRQGAEALARQAADAGTSDALTWLVGLRKRAGDNDGAQDLLRPATQADGTGALVARTGPHLAVETQVDDIPLAAELDTRDPYALVHMAHLEEWAGHKTRAEDLARQAANAGIPVALAWLAVWRKEAGDREGAAVFLKQAADAGERRPSEAGTLWPHGLDPDGSPSAPWL
ncbi:hypothetical protein [Streptomyces xinghaiensis]|uniref:hypothetical protein n=1 Tax=Streptomyces xinghaiensis TaxID=1038928 RepID=UPI003442DA74